MGAYRSLFVFKDSNWSLYVLIGLYAFLWDFIGLIFSFASFGILMGPYGFLVFLIPPEGF